MAMSANSAFCLAAIILAFSMRIVLLRANKRLARGETTVTQEMKGESQAGVGGMAEDERLVMKEGFRFVA